MGLEIVSQPTDCNISYKYSDIQLSLLVYPPPIITTVSSFN